MTDGSGDRRAGSAASAQPGVERNHMAYQFDRGTRNAAIIFVLVVAILIVMYFVGDGKNVVN